MVLISFVGRPERNGYSSTRYDFGDGAPVAASFFGSALLSRLRATGQAPTRWLLIGTKKSAWHAPAADLDGSGDVGFERLRRQLTEPAAVTQDLVDEWARAMSRHPALPECVCRIVSEGDTPESQQELWRALDEGIPCGERNVTLDVTHGYRSWPILASFMLMFLRWERPLDTVELVYGRLDPGGAPGQVVFLPLCNQLLRAAEAVATYRYTGNYVPLAKELWPENEAAVEKVRRLAYLADVQRLKPRHVRDFLQEKPPAPARCPEETLEGVLGRALESTQARASERMLRQAQAAMEHGQYLGAIVWLWEGLIMAAARVYGVKGELSDAAVRREAEQTLHDHHRDVSCTVEKLRNAAVHGTDPTTRPLGEPDRSDAAREAFRAIQSPDEFERVFEEGRWLLEALIQKEKELE